MRIILGCLFVLALIAPAPALSQAPASRYQVPAARDDGWKTANADALGVDSTKLANLTTTLRAWPEIGVHAVLIERHGQLIYEEYFDGFDEKWGTSLGKITMTAETKHDLRSVTKSVVSALVGIAHGEGAIKSLDEPLVTWFPEYPELNTAERRRVTLGQPSSAERQILSGLRAGERVVLSPPEALRDGATVKLAEGG